MATRKRKSKFKRQKEQPAKLVRARDVLGGEAYVMVSGDGVPKRVKAVILGSGVKLVAFRHGIGWGAWRFWKDEVFKSKRAALESRKPHKGFAWSGDFEYGERSRLVPVTVDVQNGQHFAYDKDGQRVHGTVFKTKKMAALALVKKARKRLKRATSEFRDSSKRITRQFRLEKAQCDKLVSRARSAV